MQSVRRFVSLKTDASISMRDASRIRRSMYAPWGAKRFTPLVAFIWLAAASAASGLNDTGQTQCYDAAYSAVACSAAVGGDNGVNPRQDARYGRDAKAAAGLLSKIGAGTAGFDFTKISNGGNALAVSASLGSAITDWACTRDNVTGLMWEIKSATAGLRSKSRGYSWYSTDSTRNGGNAGTVGTDTCGGTLGNFGNQCNTQNYLNAVNAMALCGANDWRLPTQVELESIAVDYASGATVDADYFPNPFSIFQWTASTYAPDPSGAWVVRLYGGDSYPHLKSEQWPIRLVRSAL